MNRFYRLKYFAAICCLVFLPLSLFAQNAVPETVDFSVPKNIFFTGEKVWIQASAYQNDKPSTSQVLYVELLNRENQSVYLSKFLLEKGELFHFLEIPKDIPSDHYLLRVFTRISPLVDLEKGLKQQFVTIFNPKIPPAIAEDHPGFFENLPKSDTDLSLSKPLAKAGEELSIRSNAFKESTKLFVKVYNPYLKDSEGLPSSAIYSGKAQGEFLPELFGHIVAAQIDPRTVDTTKVYFLSVHGRESALYTDRPDEKGKLYFDIGGLKHWDFMIAQADQNGDMLDFEFLSPAVRTEFASGFSFPELKISPNDQPFLQDLLISSGVQTFYTEKYEQEPIPVVTGFVADRTFLLDDYTRFESVETVIKEYVPMVSVRTRQGKKEFRSVNEFGNTFTGNPLMLVDGMPVFDSDQLAAFNPKNFEKLEILSRVFYLNDQRYEGVMSFSSYQSNVGGFPLPTNAFFKQTPGIQVPVQLEQETFGGSRINRGDFRSVLFWSNDPKASKLNGDALNLKTPDLSLPFEVELWENGEVIRRAYFRVQSPD